MITPIFLDHTGSLHTGTGICLVLLQANDERE